MNIVPKRKWIASRLDGLNLPIQTPCGKQLWHSREPNPVDKLDFEDWERAGYSAKTFEQHRKEDAAA